MKKRCWSDPMLTSTRLVACVGLICAAKSYKSQFKRQAVRLMESSEKPASDVALRLGVRRSWM